MKRTDSLAVPVTPPRYMFKETAVIEAAEELRHPISLKNVALEDYDAVYYPGGPMEDLAFDADSAQLLREALASGKPLAIVCHTAAVLATRDEHGNTPFAGLSVTGFCNEEEEGNRTGPLRSAWRLEGPDRHRGRRTACQ